MMLSTAHAKHVDGLREVSARYLFQYLGGSWKPRDVGIALPPVKIALVGYGRVGKALVDLLSEVDPSGQKFVFTGVATRKLGIMELKKSAASKVNCMAKKAARAAIHHRNLADSGEIIEWLNTSDYDVLVETIDSNYEDGEPALSYIRTAMRRGMDVVTSDKAPIALALEDLLSLGERTGARIRFESTVMDGTPIFSLFRDAMPPVRIRRIRGILNSTCNIVLDYMNNKKTLNEGLARAKSLGLTESDPLLDLNGLDSAAKLTILANALCDANLKMNQILVQPLNEQNYLSARRSSVSKSPGIIVRQVSVADFEKNIYKVNLEIIQQDDFLFSCSGSSNMAVFSINRCSELIVASRNPGLRDTAFGIYSDLIHLQRERK